MNEAELKKCEHLKRIMDIKRLNNISSKEETDEFISLMVEDMAVSYQKSVVIIPTDEMYKDIIAKCEKEIENTDCSSYEVSKDSVKLFLSPFHDLSEWLLEKGEDAVGECPYDFDWESWTLDLSGVEKNTAFSLLRLYCSRWLSLVKRDYPLKDDLKFFNLGAMTSLFIPLVANWDEDIPVKNEKK